MEQSIWFFSVPIDAFRENHGEGDASNPVHANMNPEVENRNAEWTNWCIGAEPTGLGGLILDGLEPEAASICKIWPMQVRGREVGACHVLVDLAIDAGPEMTIWTFGRDCTAKA